MSIAHRGRPALLTALLTEAKPERNRLDMFHTIFLRARHENLHKAPVRDTRSTRILDLGTGTGIWAIDMAEYASTFHSQASR